jgi:hypothetical protein
MGRRGDLLGIAELPKSAAKSAIKLSKNAGKAVLNNLASRRRPPRSGGELSRWKAVPYANGTNSPQNLAFAGMDKSAP